MRKEEMMKKSVFIILFSFFISGLCVTSVSASSDTATTVIEKISWKDEKIKSGQKTALQIELKDPHEKTMNETIRLPKKLAYQLPTQKLETSDGVIKLALKKNRLNIRCQWKNEKVSRIEVPIVLKTKQTVSCETKFGHEQKKQKIEVIADHEEAIETTTSSSITQPETSVASSQSNSTSSSAVTDKTTTTSSSKTTKSTTSSTKGRQPRSSLNNSGIVDWINVSPQNATDGERVTISAHFSEKKVGQIRPGDTITFSLPQQGRVSIVGFNKQIDLIDSNGDNIGRLDVSNGQAVVTFNRNVSDKTHISGNIRFTCEARNTNSSPQGNKGTLQTNFGIDTLPKQTITITAPPSMTTPVKNPFYYKTGRMDTNDTEHVRWWLTGNMNRESLYSDIYVVDEIQPGQEMDWSTFQISFTGGYLNGQTFTLNELQNRGIGTVYEIDDHKFVLRLIGSYVQNSQFIATYLTKVTNSAQESFTNKSKIYYYAPNENHMRDGVESNMTVDNINVGGDVDDQQQSSLNIHKIDAQTHSNLAGAEFTLVNQKTQQKYVATTDKEGFISWDHLPFGNYTLQETKAPAGYERITTIYQIEITKSGISIKNQDKYISEINRDNTIKIVNNKSKEKPTPKLPETGGTGLAPLLVTAGLLIIIGFWWEYSLKKEN